MVITTSDHRANWPMLSARTAPAASKGSVFAAVRFQTMSSKPPLRMLMAHGVPIRPSPMKPMRMTIVLLGTQIDKNRSIPVAFWVLMITGFLF